ncbi:endonuclease V [Sporobolomyces koalae]|uniref:endonuclease V n=1 Tax=Sporobolomyces koalae TaxID=500713 RepID=UPI00317DC8DB
MSTTLDSDTLARWTQEQELQAKSAIFVDYLLAFSTRCDQSDHVEVVKDVCGVPVYQTSVPSLEVSGLQMIAGFDISFRDSTGSEGIAVLAILSFPELKVIRSFSRQISLATTPYVASYLSFREVDHYLLLLEDLRKSGEELPQLLLVDGNGRWHPRQAGSATSLGVKSGIPTIGMAKDYHPIHAVNPFDGQILGVDNEFMLSQKGMRTATRKLLQERGDWIGLPGLSKAPIYSGTLDECWGAAVLTSPARNASNPIFVSPGHMISLQTCVRLVLACCVSGRVPEPVRQADLIGREQSRKYWKQERTDGET